MYDYEWLVFRGCVRRFYSFLRCSLSDQHLSWPRLLLLSFNSDDWLAAIWRSFWIFRLKSVHFHQVYFLHLIGNWRRWKHSHRRKILLELLLGHMSHFSLNLYCFRLAFAFKEWIIQLGLLAALDSDLVQTGVWFWARVPIRSDLHFYDIPVYLQQGSQLLRRLRWFVFNLVSQRIAQYDILFKLLFPLYLPDIFRLLFKWNLFIEFLFYLPNSLLQVAEQMLSACTAKQFLKVDIVVIFVHWRLTDKFVAKYRPTTTTTTFIHYRCLSTPLLCGRHLLLWLW